MAYGARLESVLGESPRGFESPILRGMKKPPLRGFFHSRILVDLYSNLGSGPTAFAKRQLRAGDPHSPPAIDNKELTQRMPTLEFYADAECTSA